MTAMGLITGLLSALTSPRLGSLSDRYGRRFLLSLSSYGLVAIELATIAVVKIPWMPTQILLAGSVVDGLCGSFMLAMALSYSYGADCTSPRKRAVAFGVFQGALFGGIAIGPVLGGLFAEATGNILNVFYVALASHVFFIFYVLFVLPESLSPRRLKLAKERYRIEKQQRVDRGEESASKLSRLNPMKFFEPLTILCPRGPGSSSVLRINLILLSIIDCIIFGVGMGGMTVILLYAERMFHWGNLEVRPLPPPIKSNHILMTPS